MGPLLQQEPHLWMNTCEIWLQLVFLGVKGRLISGHYLLLALEHFSGESAVTNL